MRPVGRFGLAAGALLLLCATCVLMIPVATRLADPITRRPLDAFREPFPLLVLSGGAAHVEMMSTTAPVSAVPGSTHLVPRGQERALEQYLLKHDSRPVAHPGWVLRVEEVAAGRQRIELFRVDDGMWGGVYEATAATATPVSRKVTGPGFALVFGPLACALAVAANAPLWGVAWYAIGRQRSGAAA